VDAKKAVAKCPGCGTMFDAEANRKHRPFCSERCRVQDLSRWLRGEYVIPGPPVLDSDDMAILDELDDL